MIYLHNNNEITDVKYFSKLKINCGFKNYFYYLSFGIIRSMYNIVHIHNSNCNSFGFCINLIFVNQKHLNPFNLTWCPQDLAAFPAKLSSLRDFGETVPNPINVKNTAWTNVILENLFLMPTAKIVFCSWCMQHYWKVFLLKIINKR